MAKRATLELLRALRRRDARARAERAVAAAEKRVEAERVVERAATRLAGARADVERTRAAEQKHVDAGGTTAGELGRAHHHRLGVEERAERSERDRAGADQGLARARAQEARAAVELGHALAGQSAVTERIAEGIRRERSRLEQRDEEGMLDAWNARRGEGRSRG